MDNSISTLALLTLLLMASMPAAQAAENEAPLISGQRSYTFSWSIKNPGEKHPYSFTKAEVDKTTCDKTKGYYWCQAKAKCLKAALEKCKLTTTGGWHDGTTSESEANQKKAASKAVKTARMTSTKTPFESTPRFGVVRQIQGSPMTASRTTLIQGSTTGLTFGRAQPPKHGPGRADWSSATTTGRRNWGGLAAKETASQTVDAGLGRY